MFELFCRCQLENNVSQHKNTYQQSEQRGSTEKSFQVKECLEIIFKNYGLQFIPIKFLGFTSCYDPPLEAIESSNKEATHHRIEIFIVTHMRGDYVKVREYLHIHLQCSHIIFILFSFFLFLPFALKRQSIILQGIFRGSKFNSNLS